jgi:hypothetical protein
MSSTYRNVWACVIDENARAQERVCNLDIRARTSFMHTHTHTSKTLVGIVVGESTHNNNLCAPVHAVVRPLQNCATACITEYAVPVAYHSLVSCSRCWLVTNAHSTCLNIETGLVTSTGGADLFVVEHKSARRSLSCPKAWAMGHT